MATAQIPANGSEADDAPDHDDYPDLERMVLERELVTCRQLPKLAEIEHVVCGDGADRQKYEDQQRHGEAAELPRREIAASPQLAHPLRDGHPDEPGRERPHSCLPAENQQP